MLVGDKQGKRCDVPPGTEIPFISEVQNPLGSGNGWRVWANHTIISSIDAKMVVFYTQAAATVMLGANCRESLIQSGELGCESRDSPTHRAMAAGA